MNLRAFVLDQLKPLLPTRWNFIDHGVSLDRLSVPTAVLLLESITKFPEAPRAYRTVNYTLSLIDPSTNPDNREDALDDEIVDLLNAIDDVPNLGWVSATRVDRAPNLGFDILIFIPISRVENDAEGA